MTPTTNKFSCPLTPTRIMMRSRASRQLSIWIWCCACLLAMGNAEAQTTLRALAKTKGKLVGTSLSSNYIDNPASMPSGYQSTLANEFNVYVAENSFKMSELLPNAPANPFDIQISDLSTAKIDIMVVRARENGVGMIRGHALIWHTQAPSWLTTSAPGWTADQITAFATSYIKAVVTYCKTINDAVDAPVRIYEWDVINETIDKSKARAKKRARGSAAKSSIEYRTGTWYDGVADRQAFIDAIFRAARNADPNVRLVYNDYGIEFYGSPKCKFMLNMVGGMVARGVPIDGVGMQCHFQGPDTSGAGGFSSSNAEKFRQTFAALRALGLEGIVTELDLWLQTDSATTEGNVTSKQLALQGDQYRLIVSTALSEPNCPSLVLWGFTDAYSWIPWAWPGWGHALPFDRSYAKKPAYEGIINAIKALPTVVENKASSLTTTLPTASAMTFCQALSNSTLSGGEGSVPGSFTFASPPVAPTRMKSEKRPVASLASMWSASQATATEIWRASSESPAY